MSKSVNSPTARLLQSSRLFSLPRALPTPQFERATASGLSRASESATLHHPILQAVTTPRASQARGDWGLKRPLPSKATRDTSTPHIRVYANDTPDCITEFTSAADHTQTRSKWQEMGVPMVRQQPRDMQIGTRTPPSVYEDQLDITDPEYRAPPSSRRDAGNIPKAGPEAQRWKFSGPYLVGMQAGEFNQYLAKTVAGRRDEWREFVRSYLHEKKIKEAELDAQRQGEPFDEARTRAQLVPTDAEVQEEQKTLRDNHADQAANSRLTILLSQFLDLAATNAPQQQVSAKTQAFALSVTSHTESTDVAPPVTHPGAGLSYIRTGAVLENHPLYGPQAHRSPVLSRVLAHREAPTGRENFAKLGVGGFVTLDTASKTTFRPQQGPSKTADELTYELDPTLEGGAKIWVHPQTATVNDAATVRVAVSRGNDEAIAVKNGDVEQYHKQRSTHARRSPAAVYNSGIPSAGMSEFPF